MNGPLAGLRILDLTTVQMGPWCTRIVADFGAEVIKVEAPEGDSSRYTGVPRHRGMSGTFQHNAKGKRSIALDLKRPEAKAAILRLAARCDGFASNIRPAALDRLGLDYESVRQANPTIVYLSMVGYGSGGRYAGRPAYDDLIQAASGVTMLLQRSTGEPRFIPMAAIDRIVEQVGRERGDRQLQVDVVAHCMGAAMFSMALLAAPLAAHGLWHSARAAGWISG
jgi:crotonobetainyl-CoA:carnitine CoA-transferase CaiB-like acyl-CoA transferase